MRTSHIKIRKRIADEKLKITDRELFTSPAFAAYLTDIAEAASKRYKRRIRVEVYWDESDGADTAYTENKNIVINAGNFLTRSFQTRKLRTDSIVGMNAHEIGHILYTDFTVLQAYVQSLLSGKMYPNEPTGLSTKDSANLDKINSIYISNDETAVRVIAETAKDIANILEDVYIEARICHAFPGVFRTGILLNNLRFPELVPSIQKQIADEYHGFAIMQNLIVQYCKTGDINNLGGYTGEYLDSLYDCVPVIDNAVYDDDVNVRYNAANIITIKLWQYIKPLIDKVTKEGKNKSGSLDRLIEGLADELNKQTVSSGKQPSGNGKPVRGNLKKYDKSAVESAKELLRKALGNETAKNGDSETDCDNNTIQEVTDDETERIKPEKTDSIDEGSDGSVIRNDSYDGAGYESAANDTERLLGKIAEEKIQKSLEDELTAELQTEADNIRYGNAHIGVNITVNRINPVNDKLIEQYNSISQPLLLLSKRMQDQISQILQNKLNGGKMTGLYMGRHIKSSHIFRNDGRIFYNTRLPEDSLDIAVALLVDESASMGGRDRITSARAASIVIYDFCVKLGIPVIVYGHSTSYGTRDVELYAYAEFDSYDMKDKYRIMDMSARSSNRDGAALRFVAERLMTRSEDIKLLILTSDGQPSAIGYTGTAAEDDLRSIKREYTNKGVTVFNAAIGDDKENIERIYGRGYLDITDLNKLPVNLTSLISSHIK